jgi:hypothetical protein
MYFDKEMNRYRHKQTYFLIFLLVFLIENQENTITNSQERDIFFIERSEFIKMHFDEEGGKS